MNICTHAHTHILKGDLLEHWVVQQWLPHDRKVWIPQLGLQSHLESRRCLKKMNMPATVRANKQKAKASIFQVLSYRLPTEDVAQM